MNVAARQRDEHERETCRFSLPPRPPFRNRETSMQIVHERCCGLDVHKKSVVACILITHADGTVQREIRTSTTMTADLLMLRDWLESLDVQQVAMESTGVFWQPIYNILGDEGRTILLVNAQHTHDLRNELTGSRQT